MGKYPDHEIRKNLIARGYAPETADQLIELRPLLYAGYKAQDEARGHAAAKAHLRVVSDDDRATDESMWEDPEDRSEAALSPHGDQEIVENLIKPGRLILVAAEEGTGKSFAIPGELGMRVAVAGGQWGETFPVLEQGPVLVLSEMPADEDYERETMIMRSLGIERAQLKGRYFRQPLENAVVDSDEWRQRFVEWATAIGLRLLIIDTATMATDVEPWGPDFRKLMRRHLRGVLAAIPGLSIILTVHLKKPQGRGDRRRQLSDVMGEWGRFTDVVVLMQGDGEQHLRLETRKRVKHQRHLRLRKLDGLLVEPVDLSDVKQQPKVSDEGVIAVLEQNPNGIAIKQLAETIGVTPKTAKGYLEKLGGRVAFRDGPHGAKLATLQGNAGDAGDADQYSWVDEIEGN
jgi:hypothetical protein